MVCVVQELLQAGLWRRAMGLPNSSTHLRWDAVSNSIRLEFVSNTGQNVGATCYLVHMEIGRESFVKKTMIILLKEICQKLDNLIYVIKYITNIQLGSALYIFWRQSSQNLFDTSFKTCVTTRVLRRYSCVYTLQPMNKFIRTKQIEVLWSKGEKPLPPLHPLLIKGRNLYRLKTMRQVSTYTCFSFSAQTIYLIDTYPPSCGLEMGRWRRKA